MSSPAAHPAAPSTPEHTNTVDEPADVQVDESEDAGSTMVEAASLVELLLQPDDVPAGYAASYVEPAVAAFDHECASSMGSTASAPMQDASVTFSLERGASDARIAQHVGRYRDASATYDHVVGSLMDACAKFSDAEGTYDGSFTPLLAQDGATPRAVFAVEIEFSPLLSIRGFAAVLIADDAVSQVYWLASGDDEVDNDAFDVVLERARARLGT